MKKIAHTILILLFLAAPGLRAQQAKPDSSKSPKSAMLKSFLVPGWGQFYNGKKLKGVIIAGGEIALLANAIALNQYAQSAETELDRLYYADNRNLSLWWLGAVIIYSMVDAYVDAHLYAFDEDVRLDIAFDARPDPSDQIVYTATVKLDF